MNKKKNAQADMKNVLVTKLYECINGISELQEKKGIPGEGLTVMVGEIVIDNRNYDMTIALTPDGVFSAFEKSQMIL